MSDTLTKLDSVDLRTLARAILNHSEDDCGLAEGTNAATIKTANTVDYVAGGLWKSYSATDNVAIPAGTVVPISSFCKFLVSINAGGTVSVTQGSSASTAATAYLPAVPANTAPLGYFQIATDATHTYTPGTTDNSAAGITGTYVDIAWPATGPSAFDETISG